MRSTCNTNQDKRKCNKWRLHGERFIMEKSITSDDRHLSNVETFFTYTCAHLSRYFQEQQKPWYKELQIPKRWSPREQIDPWPTKEKASQLTCNFSARRKLNLYSWKSRDSRNAWYWETSRCWRCDWPLEPPTDDACPINAATRTRGLPQVMILPWMMRCLDTVFIKPMHQVFFIRIPANIQVSDLSLANPSSISATVSRELAKTIALVVLARDRGIAFVTSWSSFCNSAEALPKCSRSSCSSRCCLGWRTSHFCENLEIQMSWFCP